MATRSGGVASVLATMFFLAALAVLVVVLFGRSPTLPPASHARAGTKVASKRAAKAVTSSKISTSTTSTSTAATTTTPVPVTVPNIVGLQRSAAQDTLRGVGLVSEVKGVPSSKPEGTVLGQSPQAGSSQPHGSHVYFTVASGATTSGSATGTTSTGSSTSSTTSTVVASVQVPNVVGLQRDAAQGAIHGAGLVSEVKGVPSIEPEGTILGQSPGAGTSAQRGSHVYMTVASGARPKSD